MSVEFPHIAPKGYSYEFTQFKSNVTAIWIRNHTTFDYNLGKSVCCIWGFYDSKKRTYFAPVNSKTIGKCVNINDTTRYTAMPLKQTPLTAAFV